MTQRRAPVGQKLFGEKQQDNIQSIGYLNMAGSGQKTQMEQMQIETA